MDKNIDLYQNIAENEQNKLKKYILNKILEFSNKNIEINNLKHKILTYISEICYCDNRLIDFCEQNKIKDKSKDIIISILTKTNYLEYDRVLKNNGRLYIVYEDQKENFKEIFNFFGIETNSSTINNNIDDNFFKILKRTEIKEPLELSGELIKNIIQIISKDKNLDEKKIDQLNRIDNFKVTLNYVVIEAIKKEFFFENLQQKPANRAGCIIISKKNPRNLALSYDKTDKTLFFPKGHIDDGETKEETALREATEETGIKVKLIKELEEFECTSIYNKKDKHKITFFIANSLNDEIDNEIKIEKHLITVWIDYKEFLNLDFLNPSYKELYIKNLKEIEKYINKKIEKLNN